MKILNNLLKITTLGLSFCVTNTCICTQREYNTTMNKTVIEENSNLSLSTESVTTRNLEAYKNTEFYKVMNEQHNNKKRDFECHNKEKWAYTTNMHHTNKKIRSDTAFHKYN